MRSVHVTASTDPTDRVVVEAATHRPDRMKIRFSEQGPTIYVTHAQLDDLRIAAGLAQLARSGT